MRPGKFFQESVRRTLLIHLTLGYAGKGFATEALSIFIPAFFERVPSPLVSTVDGASVGGAQGVGYDYLEALVDVENIGSQRVLEKCGFTKVLVSENDFENSMGLRSTALFRIARPGRTLPELGLLVGDGVEPWSDEAKPPIQ
jgi:RimJ/RimL family protein N-acetyltransferase